MSKKAAMWVIAYGAREAR